MTGAVTGTETNAAVDMFNESAAICRFLETMRLHTRADSNLMCNFVINRLGGRDVRASLPLDRQVKVALNDLYTPHPRRTLPDCHPC